jgi:hypothetical protein
MRFLPAAYGAGSAEMDVRLTRILSAWLEGSEGWRAMRFLLRA